MVGKEPDIGPTSRTVADNVKKLREDLGLNYTEVSERLSSAANWSINAVGIRRIEAGERRVTPDDLTALAIAFGVSPATLLMPAVRTVVAEERVELTGLPQPLRADDMWEWLAARGLPRGDIVDVQQYLSFLNRASPRWISDAAAEHYREVNRQALEQLTARMDKEPRRTYGNDQSGQSFEAGEWPDGKAPDGDD